MKQRRDVDVVALYTRLSEEDRDKLREEDDSRSIQNQKSMLISYATSHNWEIYNIYSDDDYKGSDRNRPAFNQLLKDAEKGKFNIVLCKSQSRFTRELELVEKIIHGQFVEWGIRFVGLADNADTANRGNKKSRQINGLVNEWYLEDLSDNIKTVLTDHRKRGMHIGSFALYGYQKDPEQKGHLIIDPEAAEVVREIFRLYASGMGRTNIARMLNDRGIPNPTEYKRQKGLKYGGTTKKYGTMWRYFSISNMLENEMYIGNMVQGKYENPTYKSQHSKPVPQEKWIIVPNTHEPIIDIELWNKVKAIREERAKPMCTGRVGIFAGKTRCMYCGYTMRSNKSREYYYLKCPSRHINNNSCQGSFIAQRLLEKAVIDELNKIISSYFDEEAAESRLVINRNMESKKKRLKKNISIYKDKIEDLRKAVQNSYLDKAKGLISEEEFLEFRNVFSNDIKKNEAVLSDLQTKYEEMEQELLQGRSKIEILQQYRSVEKLDRNMMETLIDYIEIGRAENKIHKYDLPPITIHWKF